MLLAMTYLLVMDHFPQLLGYDMGKWIAIAVISVLFLAGGFTAKKHSNVKTQAMWMIAATFYILALLAMLPLLGGTSSMGISFSNPIIWLLLAITAIQIWSKLSKRKRGLGDEQHSRH